MFKPDFSGSLAEFQRGINSAKPNSLASCTQRVCSSILLLEFHIL